MSERERDGERVDLVRCCEHAARLGLRQRPARGIGEVLLGNGRADCVRVAGEPRVLRADLPLEVRELAHELRSLVRFREARGFERRVASPQPVDERDEPLRLVGEAASLGEVHDRPEPAGELVDARVHVPFEREARVVQPSLQDVLVPPPHDVRVSPVRDEREAVFPEREVALVRLHRRFGHGDGKREEPLVEAALEDQRLLDEVDHLAELAQRVTPLSERVEPLADQPLPLDRIGLHAGRAERLDIRLGARHLHLPMGEPMALCRCPVALDSVGVEPRAGPPHRPREPQAGVVPAHRLAEAETADDRVQLSGQSLAQGLSLRHDPEEPVPFLQVVDGHAVALREALGCLLTQRDRRPLDPLLARLLLDAYEDRQATGADEHLVRGSAEVALAQDWKLRLRLVDRRGGKLLAADLKQQQLRQRTPGRPAARGRAPGRCTRRAPSRRSRRARRAG